MLVYGGWLWNYDDPGTDFVSNEEFGLLLAESRGVLVEITVIPFIGGVGLAAGFGKVAVIFVLPRKL